MSLPEEAYAEARASIHQPLLPYATQRIFNARTIAVSETRRFFIFVVGILGCICISTAFVYNLFSGDLQKMYRLSQSDMSTITTASSISGFITFPLSLTYDYYGPRPLFAVGFTALPLGALLYGLTFTGALEGTVFRFIVYNSLLGVGTGMFDIAVLMTTLSIFPSSRGAVIGIMKTFVGLGAAVYGAIQIGFFEHNTAHFFFFIACFTFVAGVACFIFVELPPFHLTGHQEATLAADEKLRRLSTKWVYYEQVPPMRRFLVGLAVGLVLMLFLPLQSAAVTMLQLSAAWKEALAILTIALVSLVALMAVPSAWLDGGSEAIRERLEEAEHTITELAVGATTPDERASMLVSARVNTRGSIAEEAVFRMPVLDETMHIAPQYQTSFRESICTPEIWALCFSLFCIIGTQGMIGINARFIFGSLAGEMPSPEMTALLTVTNGVGSAIGRLIIGAFEIWTQKRAPEERVPLTVALFAPTLVVLLSAALLLTVPRSLLLLPFVAAALGNGCTAATVVLVLRTLYAKDIAMHYNIGAVPQVLALVFFNKFLYGRWYTQEAERQNSMICLGKPCVRFPLVVMCTMCMISLLTNAFLHVRYTNFCHRALAERRVRQGRADGRNSNNEEVENEYDETVPLIDQ